MATERERTITERERSAEELRDVLVGIASYVEGVEEVPEGAIFWWVAQAAAAADEVLLQAIEQVEDAMRRRVARPRSLGSL